MMNVFSTVSKQVRNRRGSMLVYTVLSILALSLIAFEIGQNYVFSQKTRIASADKLDYYRMLTSVHAYFLNAVQQQICLSPEAGYIPVPDSSGQPTGECPTDWSTFFSADPENAANPTFVPEKLIMTQQAMQEINVEHGKAYDDTSWALGFDPVRLTIVPRDVATTALHPLAVLFGQTSGMRASANVSRVVVTMKRMLTVDIPFDSGADTYIKFRVELHLGATDGFLPMRLLPQVLFIESTYGFHAINNYKYALRVPGKLDLSASSATEKPYGIPRVPLSDLAKDSSGNLVGGLYFDGYTRSEGLVLPKAGQFSSTSLSTHILDKPGVVEQATASGTQEFKPATAGASGGGTWHDLNVWLGARFIKYSNYNDDGLKRWAGLDSGTSSYDPAKALYCAEYAKSNTLESTKATKVHVKSRDGGNDRSGETLTSKFYIAFSYPNYYWPQGDGGVTSRFENPAPGNPMPADIESLEVTEAVDPWARVKVRYKVGSDWVNTSALLGPAGEAKWVWQELDIEALTRDQRLALEAAKPDFLEVMEGAADLRSEFQSRLDEVIAANVELDSKQTALEDSATAIDSDLKGYRRTEASERAAKFDVVKTLPELCSSNCNSSDINEITYINYNALDSYIDTLEDALN
ncbi:MAG: hypothetical protein KDD39_14090, partial [Bdellovibrionales bacterium]|nr:hypothetical protein [Bdellovibrionales bacterium]